MDALQTTLVVVVVCALVGVAVLAFLAARNRRHQAERQADLATITSLIDRAISEPPDEIAQDHLAVLYYGTMRGANFYDPERGRAIARGYSHRLRSGFERYIRVIDRKDEIEGIVAATWYRHELAVSRPRIAELQEQITQVQESTEFLQQQFSALEKFADLLDTLAGLVRNVSDATVRACLGQSQEEYLAATYPELAAIRQLVFDLRLEQLGDDPATHRAALAHMIDLVQGRSWRGGEYAVKESWPQLDFPANWNQLIAEHFLTPPLGFFNLPGNARLADILMLVTQMSDLELDMPVVERCLRAKLALAYLAEREDVSSRVPREVQHSIRRFVLHRCQPPKPVDPLNVITF